MWNIIRIDMDDDTLVDSPSPFESMMNIYGRLLGETPDHNDMVALSLHTIYNLDIGGVVVALCGTGDDIWFATLGDAGRAVSIGNMLFMVRGMDVAVVQLSYLFPNYTDQLDNMEAVFMRTEPEVSMASGYISATILGGIEDGVSIRGNT